MSLRNIHIDGGRPVRSAMQGSNVVLIRTCIVISITQLRDCLLSACITDSVLCRAPECIQFLFSTVVYHQFWPMASFVEAFGQGEHFPAEGNFCSIGDGAA